MKKYILFIVLMSSANAFAGGWTNSGSVEFVELVRGQGFLVKGDFGSGIGCVNAAADYLWVAIDHPQYDQLYSTVLAGYMAGKKIRAYAHTCTEIGWHGGSYSTLNGAGSLYLQN